MTSLSATDHSGVSHAATASWSTITLQAPHSLVPQPKCAPVMPSGPRSSASSDESGSASTSVSRPLSRKRILAIEKDLDLGSTLLLLVSECLDHVRPLHDV